MSKKKMKLIARIQECECYDGALIGWKFLKRGKVWILKIQFSYLFFGHHLRIMMLSRRDQ